MNEKIIDTLNEVRQERYVPGLVALNATQSVMVDQIRKMEENAGDTTITIATPNGTTTLVVSSTSHKEVFRSLQLPKEAELEPRGSAD